MILRTQTASHHQVFKISVLKIFFMIIIVIILKTQTAQAEEDANNPGTRQVKVKDNPNNPNN